MIFVITNNFPVGSQIAEGWEQKYHYPMDDSKDLISVSQFLAVQYDRLFPKEEIVKLLKNFALPNFRASDEPHGVFADLPFSVYITTNL